MKKILAVFLALITCVCLFAGCGKAETDKIVLPVQNVEDTYENRVAALLETAWAYYYKNDYLQYCSMNLCISGRANGVRTAQNMNNTPEMFTAQRTGFLTCSSYTYHTIYHTFDFEPTDYWFVGIPAFMNDPDLQPYIVWQYIKEGNTKTPDEAMKELQDTLLPGDMIYYTRDIGSEHATIWLGDYDGDGDQDMINVDGTYYDAENKRETPEEGGAVDINTDRWDCPSAEQFFFDPTAFDYFHKLSGVSVFRFCDEKHMDTLQLTERAKTRLLYPGLEIRFEAEDGIYGSVAKNGEYTFTLTIENHSQQNYEGLLVQLPTPKNAEIIRVMGAEKANKTVKMTINIAAGKTAVIDYTVKATGNVGDIIETGTPYVHAIPLPSLNTAIVSRKADAAQVKKALDAAKTQEGEAFVDAYLKGMGLELSVPTADEVLKGLYSRIIVGEFKVYSEKEDAEIGAEYANVVKMQIPEYFGGQLIATDVDSLRIKELRAKDLQAGDILLWKEDTFATPMAAIHDGENLLYPANGQLLSLTQEDLDAFIMHDCFFALRPTQAM